MAVKDTDHLSSTTQQYLDIADITNDLLILKDGSVSLVLEVSAINFGLLSEPEQDAIIYAYAAMINSLSFSIEIVISSRPKDVSVYLEFIDEQFNQSPSDMRRRQIASYRQFVANLITEQNVLDKNFFVVISLSALEAGVVSTSNPVNMVGGASNKPVQIDRAQVLERGNNILGPRRDHLISQFNRFGLRSRQMNTKELIHLFYVLYNGQEAEGTKVVDTREYTSAIIQAQGVQAAPSFTSTPAPVAPPPSVPAATTPAETPAAATPQATVPASAPANNPVKPQTTQPR